MVEIVLCATQRCGSTMVVEDMRNTNVLGRPEEWFIPWDPSKEDVDWKEALVNLRRRATDDTGTLAVKVMANQLTSIEECLKSVTKPPPGPTFFRFQRIFRDATFVWLKREDIVAQAVSRIMAQQTGINHATDAEDHFAGNLMKGGDRANYNVEAKYSYNAILRECTSITLENLAWSRFFSSFEIDPLVVVYEDVAKDPDMMHLDAIVKHAGLETDLVKSERRIVKIGNSKNDKFINKFHKDAAQNQFRSL